MSWSSEWLRDWLKRNDTSQVAFARTCGVAPGNVSRWLSGSSRPDREVAETLCSILPENEAREFLIAWTKDTLPKGSEKFIRIQAQDDNSRSTLREEHRGAVDRLWPEGISRELRERLIYFSHLAVEFPEIRKILDVCYEAAKRTIGAESPRSRGHR